MRAILLVPPVSNILKLIDIQKEDYVVAVDQALEVAVNEGIRVSIAIGDFDSVRQKELLKEIKIKKLSEKKDYTDTYEALMHVKDKGYESIYMIGGIGGFRIEHFIANLTLFEKAPTLIIRNEYTEIKRLNQGYYTIYDKGYISFFGYSKALISLKQFWYPLSKYELEEKDPLCISNHIQGDRGIIEIHEGSVLMFTSIKV